VLTDAISKFITQTSLLTLWTLTDKCREIQTFGIQHWLEYNASQSIEAWFPSVTCTSSHSTILIQSTSSDSWNQPKAKMTTMVRTPNSFPMSRPLHGALLHTPPSCFARGSSNSMVYNVSTSGLAALPRQVAQALDKQKALAAAP